MDTSKYKYLKLNEYLKFLREKTKLTQTEIAEKLQGVHPQLISNLERGKSMPSDALCVELAKLYGLEDKHELLVKKYQEKLTKDTWNKILNSVNFSGKVNHGKRIQVIQPQYCNLNSMTDGRNFTREAVQSTYIMSNIEDEKAFFVPAINDSNSPKIEKNDLLLVCPSFEVKPGDFCCIIYKEDFSIRIFHLQKDGVVLRCANHDVQVLFYEIHQFEHKKKNKEFLIYPITAIIRYLENNSY